MNAVTSEADQRPGVAVFHNMARSGGTMVCKCIGAMQGVRLFSEIHPAANFAEYLNVTDQAARWYGLAERETGKRRPFLEGVRSVQAACEAEGSRMVLRDWASVDFIGKVLVEEPVGLFSLNAALAPHFRLDTCALVRHPMDQWLSTRRLKVYTNKLTFAEFLAGYRRFTDAVGERFVRYEDFTRDPETVMAVICDMLNLTYDPGFMTRWHSNTCITGDNKNSSRGSENSEAHRIRPLPRRQVEPALAAEAAENPDYLWITRRLAYQTDSEGSV